MDNFVARNDKKLTLAHFATPRGPDLGFSSMPLSNHPAKEPSGLSLPMAPKSRGEGQL